MITTSLRRFLSILLLSPLLASAPASPEEHSLEVVVEGLRNSKGRVRFNLYDRDNVFPDEDFERTCEVGYAAIEKGRATYRFEGLPEGDYAVNILHDENRNDEIDKGYILPEEGIGFSNYESIGLMNKPEFSKASISLLEDRSIDVKTIYF
jgi:uncharacterized protein (DUF2141 family)